LTEADGGGSDDQCAIRYGFGDSLELFGTGEQRRGADSGTRLAKSQFIRFTTRRWRNPKLLMARAAAPMLRGLRGLTRTTRKRSIQGGQTRETSLQQERSNEIRK